MKDLMNSVHVVSMFVNLSHQFYLFLSPLLCVMSRGGPLVNMVVSFF